VGGMLGDGAGALPLVLGQRTAEPAVAAPLLAHYWSPPPQFALGQALRGRASSALDISDGLLADCGHIANASKVLLRVERERLPLSNALQSLLGPEGARAAALSGGDDYVLAFTLPPVHESTLRSEGVPFVVVGEVLEGQGVRLVDGDGQDITPLIRGYQHFPETP